MLIIQLIQQCLHTTTFADACTAKEQNIFACQNGLQHRVSFLYGERMIADGAEVGLEPMIQTLDLQWDIDIGGQKPALVSPLFQILLQYPRRERFAIIIVLRQVQKDIIDIIRVPGEHTAEHVFPLISLYRIITERTYFKLPQIECRLFLIRCCLSQSKIFSPLIE